MVIRKCCFLNPDSSACPNDAVWEIREIVDGVLSNEVDGYTDSCEAHIGSFIIPTNPILLLPIGVSRNYRLKIVAEENGDIIIG